MRIERTTTEKRELRTLGNPSVAIRIIFHVANDATHHVRPDFWSLGEVQQREVVDKLAGLWTWKRVDELEGVV